MSHRERYPFHRDIAERPVYTPRQVAEMMRRLERHDAKQRKARCKEMIYMLTYNVIVIGLVIGAFIYLSN